MDQIAKLKAKVTDAKAYDDRAKAAVEFLLRTLLGYSSAIVALFFVALTMKVDPALTTKQGTMALGAVLAHSTAALSALLYVFLVYKHNSRRARLLIAPDDPENWDRFRRLTPTIGRLRGVTLILLLLAFLAGLAFTLAFLYFRLP